MFGVIRRRNGRTIHEDMQQGSQTFTVTAILPVIESFQFANEIRKQTSGMATPMLVFSHWEVSTSTSKLYLRKCMQKHSAANYLLGIKTDI
jgi:translation elongation factor, putative